MNEDFQSMMRDIKEIGLTWEEISAVLDCDSGVLRRIYNGEVTDPRATVAHKIRRLHARLKGWGE